MQESDFICCLQTLPLPRRLVSSPAHTVELVFLILCVFFLYLFLLNNRKWEFRRCLRCFFLCVFFPLTNQIWSPASILKMLSAFASLHFAAIIFNIPIITQCYPHSQWLSLHAFQQISKNFPWSPASKTAALCHIHMEIASTETYTPTHSYCQQTVN